MKKILGLLVIVVVLSCAFGWSGHAQKRLAKPTWEYKTFNHESFR
jgi:hypothetical protein